MGNEFESHSLGAGTLVEDLLRSFQQLRGACLRVAASVVRDLSLAEEVVQEAFLAAWQHAPHRYDPRQGSLETWILTLTRHKAIDAVRHAEHQRRVRRLEEAEPRRDSTPDQPEDLVVRTDEARRLHRHLLGLPAPQQRVLLLMYWYGLSQTQISTSDAVPLGTVKSRTTTALKRLRGSAAGDLR